MIGLGMRRATGEQLDAVTLTEIRAALSAGAAPSAALSAARRGPLARAGRALRLGQPLAEIARQTDTGDVTADLLVRALALAEEAGAGACEAVDQALLAMREDSALARLLAVRTVQARATAGILTAVPALAWLLLVVSDRSAVAFYGTPGGRATGLAAAGLAAAGLWWSRRIVGAAERAAQAADPLIPPRAPPDARRIVAVVLPAAALATLGFGPGAGLVVGGAAAIVALRTGAAASPSSGQAGASGEQADPPARTGGAAEAIELIAIALTSGLSPTAAVAAAAPLAPPSARPVLAAAARQLRAGRAASRAFSGTGLARLGEALSASERWGAPAAPALRGLAEELRADRRAAAEAAAERAQVSLIFPTTLLTLPAFVLAVVPPLLWTAVAGTGGFGLN